MLKINCLTKSYKLSLIFKSNLNTSAALSAGKQWRQSNNLPKLQTARGPLTDAPDYSFIGILDLKFVSCSFLKSI
jgi:hypothetical protein